MLRNSQRTNRWTYRKPGPWSDGIHHLTIPSLIEFTGKVREAFQRELKFNGFSWPEICRIVLTLEEALVNAIKHGNEGDPEKSVSVRFRVNRKCVWVHVKDQGRGFNPALVPDPTLPEYTDRSSGRGVFLMRNFMDIVRFNRTGNAVFLCKSRREPRN